MIKKVFFALMLLTAINLTTGQRKEHKKDMAMDFPMNEKYWATLTKNVVFTNYKSVPAVRSRDKNGFGIMLKDFEFMNGVIEFDVELKGMGFPGIDFRIDKDTLNSEKFYLRYFGTPDNFKRTTLQYAAVMDGVNLWNLTDDYQAAAKIYEGRWNHVKLMINGRQMRVFVNDMETVALHVPALEGTTKSGKISLSGNVIYANFSVRPHVTEDELPSFAGYDPTYNDPRYLRSWSVSEPKDLPFERDVMSGIRSNPGVAIAKDLLDSTEVWKPIDADRRALVNLTRLFGNVEQGERKLAWLKTNIYSKTAQEKGIDMGFSDEVWVFINGQPLLTDKNYYGSPGMKEPRGRCTLENTSFKLPLTEGENEILIGVANYFFGWGFIARLADNDGVEFK